MKLNQTPESKLRHYASQGRDDLLFLCEKVLGYTKVRPNPHQDLIRFIESKEKRKKLILMPRGSFKSSVVTVANSIQRLIKNPNLRILIASETQKKSIKFVKEIRSHFESNQKFRALYGDWTNKGNTWRDGEFVIRPRFEIKKEPSVSSGSLEKGTQVGMHYDLILLDDVVSITNISTPDQIEKTINFYKLLLSILEPDGEILIVGTRWGHYELYGWLMDPENEESQNFDVFHRAAEDDAGNLLMPDILSREYLDEMKKTQGHWIYNCQYLNKVENSELSAFKSNHLVYYDKAPEGLVNFMTIDPAISLKDRSDFTGIIINGCDYDHNWYILEALKIKVEPDRLIEMFFELSKKYYPIMVCGLEKFALEKMLRVNLFREMEKRNFFVPIKDLETSTKISKEARIRALQPRFESGQILIKKEHTELAHEILNFPNVRHDDLLDALKSQLQITFPSDNKPVVGLKKDLSHLSKKEQAIWNNIDNIAKRKVRRTQVNV